MSHIAGTDCLSILENGYSFGDGLYWIAPYDLEPIQVYCDMTTDGGGWTMFSDVVSNTNNWEVSLYRWARLIFGEVGDAAYSLNIDPLYQAVDELFDVMMQYGDEEVHHIIQYDYQKFGSSFHVPIGEAGGGHQRLGIKSEDTYYVTDCGDVYAFYIQSSCNYTNYHRSRYLWFWSKRNQYLDQLFLYGDNIPRQRSFVRYVWDKDRMVWLQTWIATTTIHRL